LSGSRRSRNETRPSSWPKRVGVGMAIGVHKGRPCCILVFTDSGTEQVREKIPSTVAGHPVVVPYVGKVLALDPQ